MPAKKQYTILVLEDERPLLAVIRAKLEKNGFEVVTARTCDQAVDYLIDINPIHVVWLDHYLLGKKTGLDFLARMRSSEDWRNIPVFVVTNTGTMEKKESYMGLGATKYFVKSNHRLGSIVDDILQYLQHPPQDDQPSTPPTAIFTPKQKPL